MRNIYYHPEECGFSVFYTLDQNADCGFDIFLILKKNDTEELFYATDSGCSCPSPFDDTDVSNFVPIRTDEQLRDALDAWSAGGTADKQDVIQKVKTHLKAQKTKTV